MEPKQGNVSALGDGVSAAATAALTPVMRNPAPWWMTGCRRKEPDFTIWADQQPLGLDSFGCVLFDLDFLLYLHFISRRG